MSQILALAEDLADRAVFLALRAFKKNLFRSLNGRTSPDPLLVSAGDVDGPRTILIAKRAVW